ncbi:hypothetical protein ACFL4T_04655 [candidate division KSB1 bacterium]
MKKFLLFLAAGFGLFLLLLIIEYKKATFIPDWYYKVSGQDNYEITKNNGISIGESKAFLSEQETESLLKVLSIVYFNENKIPPDIIKQIKVNFSSDLFKIGVIINFKKLDLEIFHIENIPITLRILKFINPEILYAEIEGNNRIIDGKLILDEETDIFLGKKGYKVINLLQNGESSDIFLNGIDLPENLKHIQNTEYQEGKVSISLKF